MTKREIKFRGWNLVDKRWDKTSKVFGMNDYFKELGNGVFRFNRGDVILMQYTGLKDKNGKEIYEGDIVLRPKGNILKGEQWNEVIRAVEYNNYHGGFCWADWRLDKEIASKGKVIGNIYENPELLKQSNL